MSDIPISVAIVGAGLGGLTLARILQHTAPPGSIKVHVYERDAPHDTRPDHGGSLDIHGNSGQAALKAAGLFEEFEKIMRTEDDVMNIFDKHGNLTFDEEAFHKSLGRQMKTGDRPEVDRGQLRALLLGSLEPEIVQWSHTLKAIIPRDDGKGFRLTFDTPVGELNLEPSLVVGADGAFSTVRKVLSDAPVTYAGVSFVEIHLRNAAREAPRLAALVKRGTASALGGLDAILPQCNAGGAMRIYCASRAPESWLDSVDWSDTAAARAALLKKFEGWNEAFLEAITAAPAFVGRRLRELPIGHSWEHKAGVTLIGDAAHLMVPFAGEGANLAMLDGAELAKAIVDNIDGGDLDAAIAAFEKTMCERAGSSAKRATRNMDIFMNEGAAENAAALFKKLLSGAFGPPQ